MARYEIMFQCGILIAGSTEAPWAQENLTRETCPVKTCHCPLVGIYYPDADLLAATRKPGRPKKSESSHE